MLSFLEYSFKDLAIEYICNQNETNFIDFFASKRKFKTVFPENSQNLEVDEKNNGSDLFNQQVQTKEPLIIDLIDKVLPVSTKLNDLIESTDQFYLTRSQKPLTAVEKKDLKKAKIEIVELKKPNPKTLQELLGIYMEQKQVSITPNLTTKILKNMVSYVELIDLLDLYKLSEQDTRVFASFFEKEQLLPFMKGINLDSNISSKGSWYNISPDDIQLHVSVMLSKLVKIKESSKSQVVELIKTDYTMKQVSGISPLIWWKLYLYKISKS